MVDEEEFQLILKLKDLKKQYRSEYRDLLDLRAEIQYCQRLVDQCRHRLLTGAPAVKLEAGNLGSGVGVPSELLPGTSRGWARVSAVWFPQLWGPRPGPGAEPGAESAQGSWTAVVLQRLLLCPQGSSLLTGLSPCPFAEFDIWYNESFVIPADVQMALKPGGSIRPGMVPSSKITSLVSSTGGGRCHPPLQGPLFLPRAGPRVEHSQLLPQLPGQVSLLSGP